MRTAVEQEIHDLIRQHGRITFAQFMQTCLYSPRGGFFAARTEGIDRHFGTAPSSHPAFGALIARQLEQMWRLLGAPRVFHCVEVGSGDGTLAQAITQAVGRAAPRFAQALQYVATDYAPHWLHAAAHNVPWNTVVGTPHHETPSPLTGEGGDGGDASALRDVRLFPPSRPSPARGEGASEGEAENSAMVHVPIQRVKADGIGAFRNIVGCVLCNELIDNFPVHRFAIENGRVKEVFVTIAQGALVETLDEPSTPLIRQRLDALGLSLPDGYRGEVNLAMAGWTSQLAAALARGFVLTIDYGELAADLYAPANRDGTLVCYHQHELRKDPYQHAGEQDITALVDFSSLMRLGEQHGLTTVGYARQAEFLAKLGFSSFADELEQQALSAARKTLARMALMSLVDPEQYGDFKILVQGKRVALEAELLGLGAVKT